MARSKGALDLPRVEVASRDEWRDWLARNHAGSGSIWLVTHKKAAGDRHLPYEAIVEEALAFGWIDSRPAKLDAERSMLLISPRKPGSAWSRANKERVERLLAEGRMALAGLAAVEAAKADGSWNALDEVERLAIPPDLAAALAAQPPAEANFAAFPRSAKRGILEWIGSARRPETRAKRVAVTVAEAAAGRPANAWKGRKT